MTTITPDEISRLREIEGRATPGPWSVRDTTEVEVEGAYLPICTVPFRYFRQTAPDDVELIAESRNALPALLDAAEAGVRRRSEILEEAAQVADRRAQAAQSEEEREACEEIASGIRLRKLNP